MYNYIFKITVYDKFNRKFMFKIIAYDEYEAKEKIRNTLFYKDWNIFKYKIMNVRKLEK